MLKAISIWAFTADKTLDDCLKLAKAAGFAAIELAYAKDGFIRPGMSDQELAEIRAKVSSYGLALPTLASGIFWSINPLSDCPDERAEAKVHVREMLRAAHLLGAKTILYVPGSIGPFMAGKPVVADYEVAYNRAIGDIKELAADAERLQVNIGVENVWNRFLVSPLEMRQFIDAIGSDYVGVYFDVGNVLRTGYPQHWIRILGNRIKAVHLKDFRVNVGTLEGFVELLEGDVDYPAVMAAFREIGYDGSAVVEQFPPAQYPDAMIYRASRAVDVIFGGKAQ